MNKEKDFGYFEGNVGFGRFEVMEDPWGDQLIEDGGTVFISIDGLTV